MQRITLRHIAEKVGVSVMTVSLALRDAGRVSAKLRRSIKDVAKSMGYRPDPALSALVAYRHDRQIISNYETLAFLTNFPSEFGWKEEIYTQRYFEGAVSRAKTLGYRVEPFWLRQPKLSPRRAAQILEARGIKGVLVAPIPAASGKLELNWEKLCAVSLCRNLVSPDINVVDHNHYQSMSMTWRELQKRGYKKIGYVVSEYSENITGRLWLATFLMEQKRSHDWAEECIEPLVAPKLTREILAEWIQDNTPDVIISQHLSVYNWLLELGFRIPEQIGFAWLEAEAVSNISGVCQHFPNVGIAAVDLLHLELIRSSYGIPSVKQTICIDGFWVDGLSLRKSRR